MTSTFPPTLTTGNRVWTQTGYSNHGPLDGPKVDINGNQGGTITDVEKPYRTMDQLLYTVRWDNGQTSKHYGKELFCIGRFQSRTEFEQAIKPIGDVELIVGPAGGIKSARFQINYDGQLQTAEVDRRLWLECIEPIAQSRGLTITKTKLQNH